MGEAHRARLAGGWEDIVERDDARDAIREAIAEAAHGHGRFVILYGQAGIGRSRLLHAAVAEAAEQGLDVLRSSGTELESGYRFGVVRQLLEARVAALTRGERRALLATAGPAAEWALGIGRIEERVPSAGFEEIHSLYRLVVGLAEISPLMIAVDDLQWSDRLSLDFLCFLGHRTTELPVTVVACWRRGEPGVRAGRLQALAAKRDTSFLSLGLLSRDGVRAMLARENGSPPHDEALDAVYACTGGHPFLARELAAGLRMRDLALSAGSWEAIEAVTPESVRRHVVARLGRHSQTAERFAHAVAVLGQASLAQAAELAEIDPDEARPLAGSLARAGILVDDSPLAYAQPLLRGAVYETLGSLDSADWHRRAAKLLHGDAPGAERHDPRRVAEHLLRSEPVGDRDFGEVLREAARCAADAGAFGDAVRYLERALTEIDDDATRGTVLIELAELELRAGSAASSASRAGEALALVSESRQRAHASLVGAQALAATAGAADAEELLESERRLLGKGDTDLGLGLRATAAILRACAGARPLGRAGASTDVERLAGDTAAQQAMLAAGAAHMTLTGEGSANRVGELCRRALPAGAPELANGLSDTVAYVARCAALMAEVGEPTDAPCTAGDAPHDIALKAQLALFRGDLKAAEGEARRALALVDGLPPSPLQSRVACDLLVIRVVAALERARVDEAEHDLARLVEAGGASDAAISSLRMALALARSVPAADVAADAEKAAEPLGVAAPGMSWRPWAALAYHHAAGERRAVALATAHLEHARAWGAPSALGRALVVRGVVGSATERLRFITEGVEVLERTPAKLELARAAVELGVALRRARKRREARELLVRGADLAHQCGADALAARARTELVAAGARPRRAAFTGVESLTASELRVARLAAGGMTNRAIAQALTVSPKTVSGQLTAVYRKLDVHDRTALAEAMRDVAPDHGVVTA